MGAIVLAVVTPIVVSMVNVDDAKEELTGQGPISVDGVDSNPGGSGTNTAYAFPDKVTAVADRAALLGLGDVHEFLRVHPGVPVQTLRVRVLLRSSRDGLKILGGRILLRNGAGAPALRGTYWGSTPQQGGPVEPDTKITGNLDVTPPLLEVPDKPGTSFFQDQTLAFSKNTQTAVQFTFHTAAKYFVFDIELDYVSAGHTHQLLINNNGRHFEVTGLPTTARDYGTVFLRSGGGTAEVHGEDACRFFPKAGHC